MGQLEVIRESATRHFPTTTLLETSLKAATTSQADGLSIEIRH